MGCKIIVKIVLLILNLLFGLAGAAIGALGGLLRWGNDAIWEKLIDWVNTILQQAGVDIDAGNLTSIDSGVDLTPIVNSFGIVLFVIGLVLLVIAATGFFGTLFNSKILLKIYTGTNNYKICNIEHT